MYLWMFKLNTKSAQSLSYTYIESLFVCCLNFIRPCRTAFIRTEMELIFFLRRGCGLAVLVACIFCALAPPSGKMNTTCTAVKVEWHGVGLIKHFYFRFSVINCISIIRFKKSFWFVCFLKKVYAWNKHLTKYIFPHTSQRTTTHTSVCWNIVLFWMSKAFFFRNAFGKTESCKAELWGPAPLTSPGLINRLNQPSETHCTIVHQRHHTTWQKCKPTSWDAWGASGVIGIYWWWHASSCRQHTTHGWYIPMVNDCKHNFKQP